MIMEIHVQLGIAQHVRRAQLIEHLPPSIIDEFDRERVLHGFRALVILAKDTVASIPLRVEWISVNDYAIIYSDDVRALQRIQCYQPPEDPA